MLPPRVDASRPRIRLRFTALYASTLLVVLLAAAVALRYAIRRTLEHEFDDSVRSSAQLVRQFFRSEIAEYRTVEATLTHITGELVFEDRAIRVRRPDGTLYGESSAAARRARRRLVQPVRSVTFPLDVDLAPGWQVEVDASLDNVHGVQEQIDRWFGVGIPLLVLTAAFAGWWLTGRTLRPVGAMADAASRIAPASGARLPIDNPDDELGRLGVRFNALLDRLDGALSQQRQFLADAAHELRTPIARMRARVELALLDVHAAEMGERATPIAQRRATLAELEDELRSVSLQLEQLLQLARADAAGDAALGAPAALFLDDLVADEAPRWRARAQQLGVTFSYDALEEAPVEGDATLLARLFGVLVDNALRYAGRDGAAAGQVQVAVQATSSAVRLVVEDDGPGVPPAERERIFDRFYRGGAARARRPDGSGLGLAIAAWIVRGHGGTLTVSDSALGGARFVVELPRSRSADR